MTHDGWRTWLALAAGITAPLAVAAAMVPLRATIDNANVALVLAAVVVAVAMTGSRAAVLAAAASAAVWFDFFHTRPYESFTVNDHDDIVTALVLLAVGVLVGELAIRSRRHRSAATTSSGDIARIHAVAELVAAGEPSELVAAEVADELLRLLELRDCRFEAGPRMARGARRSPSWNETATSSTAACGGASAASVCRAGASVSRSRGAARRTAVTC